MSEIFLNSKMASRIFAFIESKYSSKIEGIYTTLFENVNTGISSKNANLIKPIVDSLFNKEKEKINKIYIDKLEKILNENQNKKKR
jgi:CRISPR/Cas system endoribonuclease Cas6 (RAMP superfamily)